MHKRREVDADSRGAVLVGPTPPKRGTFAVLVPVDTCVEMEETGGMIRLDFRPRTLREKKDLWRGRRGQ